MTTLTIIRILSCFLAAVLGLFAWYEAYRGFPIVATLVALPAIGILALAISPSRGIGHFALTFIVIDEGNSRLSIRQQELRAAYLWLIGACLVPLGVLSGYALQAAGMPEGASAYAVVGVLAFVGFCCFLKALGAFFRAWRARPRPARISPPWQTGQYVTYYGERPDGYWQAFDLKLAGQLEDSSWAMQANFKSPLGEGTAWLRTDPKAKEGDLDVLPGKLEVVRTSTGFTANEVELDCMGQMATALNLLMVNQWKSAHEFVRTRPSQPASFPCGVSSVHEYVTDGPGYMKHHHINPKVMLTGISCYSIDGANNPLIATSFGISDPQLEGSQGNDDHIDLSFPKRIQHDGFALTYPATWFMRPEMGEEGKPAEPARITAVVGGNAGAITCGVTIHRGTPEALAAKRNETAQRLGSHEGPDGIWKARPGATLALQGDAQGYVVDRVPSDVHGVSYAALFMAPQENTLARVSAVAVVSKSNPNCSALLAAMDPVLRGILESFEFTHSPAPRTATTSFTDDRSSHNL